MKRLVISLTLLTTICLLCAPACLNVRTPDVRINAGPPPQDVDSSQVPQTDSHEEARRELEKAYRHIRYLEHQIHDLKDDVEEERERGDEYKRKYKRLRDKYDD